MNNSHVEGGIKEAAGSVQKAAGKIFNDDQWAAEGTVRETLGRAQRAYGDARDQLVDAVEHQPVTALLLAAAVGYALAVLTRR